MYNVWVLVKFWSLGIIFEFLIFCLIFFCIIIGVMEIVYCMECIIFVFKDSFDYCYVFNFLEGMFYGFELCYSVVGQGIMFYQDFIRQLLVVEMAGID